MFGIFKFFLSLPLSLQPPSASSRDQPPTALACNVCHVGFSSRNKLFQHIKDSGHALHIASATGKGKREAVEAGGGGGGGKTTGQKRGRKKR